MVLSAKIQQTLDSMILMFIICAPTRGRKSRLFSLRCQRTTTPSSPPEYKQLCWVFKQLTSWTCHSSFCLIYVSPDFRKLFKMFILPRVSPTIRFNLQISTEWTSNWCLYSYLRCKVAVSQTKRCVLEERTISNSWDTYNSFYTFCAIIPVTPSTKRTNFPF